MISSERIAPTAATVSVTRIAPFRIILVIYWCFGRGIFLNPIFAPITLTKNNPMLKRAIRGMKNAAYRTGRGQGLIPNANAGMKVAESTVITDVVHRVS
jgi:hypothetical protein